MMRRPAVVLALLLSLVAERALAGVDGADLVIRVAVPPDAEPGAAPEAAPNEGPRPAAGDDADSPIVLACNWWGWNPADPRGRMQRAADGLWELGMSRPAGSPPLEWKFVLGTSWDGVETDASGADVPNRTLPATADPIEEGLEAGPPRYTFRVAGFRSAGSDAMTLEEQHTGDVREFRISGGGGPARNLERVVYVWLPPGYDEPANADRAYPLLVMQDGQNVFASPGGGTREWHADETAQKLVFAGEIEPIVIAAVSNAGAMRNSEYLPVESIPGLEPLGTEYAAWMVNTLLPQLRAEFRVRRDAAGTFVGGSSLGATIALWASTEHPGVFGGVLAESLPLVSAPEVWDAYIAGVETWPAVLYLGVGGREYGQNAANAEGNRRYEQRVRELAARDFGPAGPERLMLLVGPEAEHNEDSWAARFGDALKHLFPPRGPAQ